MLLGLGEQSNSDLQKWHPHWVKAAHCLSIVLQNFLILDDKVPPWYLNLNDLHCQFYIRQDDTYPCTLQSSCADSLLSIHSVHSGLPVTGNIYESCDRGAPGEHVQQTRRHPKLALKVTQASTPLQLVPVWLCHWHYDFITLERRGRERKKNSLHSSVNVHLKLQLNQSPARINRERLGRLGGEWREEGRIWRCPLKDRRITDQYGRMDFVILKRAVRGSFTPTCSELYPPAQAADDTSVHHAAVA